jgi:hypothetical protein
MFPAAFWPASFFQARFWPKLGTGIAPPPQPALAQLGGGADWEVFPLGAPPCDEPTWIEDDQVIVVGSPWFVGWSGHVG